jgi:hypothetical protein
MGDSIVTGPHKATIIERIVGSLRIPYVFGSVLLAFLLGPPGAILSTFVFTRDIFEAFNRVVWLFFGSSLPFLQGYLGLSLLFVLFYYLLYMIQFMRQRLVSAEAQLVSLLPEGEVTFDAIFGTVSKSTPPVAFAVLFMLVIAFQSVPELPDNFAIFCINNANTVFLLVAFPFWFIAFCTFVWVYVGSIRGLYDLGKKVKLKTFNEDKMLGVRPVGSLSLNLTYTYFVGLIILGLLPTILQPEASFLGYMVVLSICAMVGLILFFLPQYTLHKKMVEAKEVEKELLRRELSKVVRAADEEKVDVESAAEIKDALNRLTTVLQVDMTKNELESIPTWPFDTQIISRLAGMTMSIIIVIIAQWIMRRVIYLIPN